MPTGQAAVVALGVVVAVFGAMYLSWRAQQPDRTASILRTLLNASFVGMGLWAGTILLLMEPHELIRSGVGVLAYTSVVIPAFLGWRQKGMVPSLSTGKKMMVTYSLGNVVTACLLGAACVRHGGPIGVLGAMVALSWITLHLWFLKTLLKLDGTGRPPTPVL